jgi:hypothetical protein
MVVWIEIGELCLCEWIVGSGFSKPDLTDIVLHASGIHDEFQFLLLFQFTDHVAEKWVEKSYIFIA